MGACRAGGLAGSSQGNRGNRPYAGAPRGRKRWVKSAVCVGSSLSCSHLHPFPTPVRAGVGHQHHDSLSLSPTHIHTRAHTHTLTRLCSWGLYHWACEGFLVGVGEGRWQERERAPLGSLDREDRRQQLVDCSGGLGRLGQADLLWSPPMRGFSPPQAWTPEELPKTAPRRAVAEAEGRVGSR